LVHGRERNKRGREGSVQVYGEHVLGKYNPAVTRGYSTWMKVAGGKSDVLIHGKISFVTQYMTDFSLAEYF
jgi:hypothetical protein